MMNDIDQPRDSNDFDIAIIGMAGRFPGAKNIDEFWHNLRSGVESITVFSDEELIESGVESAKLNDPNYVKAAPILDSPEYFDAAFFDYFPREAKFMDPQHRIFLECAWETLENAGYKTEKCGPRIGVYAGMNTNTYLLFSGLLAYWDTEILPILIGNDKDFLTTRISYKLNLKGPSITVQSACSTSLVAVHLACQSLLNQECDMALAGGVTVRVPHRVGYMYQEGNITSPDGHCRAFDAKAKGTIFGSGVGIVLLKRLEDAIVEEDNIYAVIKGSAINNDGSLKAGFTAPSIDGQTEVVLEAQANAGVNAETITYIEAHGTGTILGDPIEVAALTKAFRSTTDKRGYCAIGSVKTNVGHLDAAAGITGLIKTVLALKHKQIPPTLHFEKPNPEIDFENSPFYINNTLIEWNSNPFPRRAGVSSLGVGGTNVHIILEEAPIISTSSKTRPWQLLLLSAKTNTGLDKATGNFIDYLKQNPDLSLPDVAFTLQVGRKGFDQRRMIVCKDLKEGVQHLETLNPKNVKTKIKEIENPSIAFMFSGQGSQYVNMGLELYCTESVFKDQIDQSAELLRPYLSFDIRDVIYPKGDNINRAAQELTQTAVTQPALFIIEYALAKLWMSWDVKPVALVGHSIGEYVAACLSGVISLEDALILVTSRGRLMQDLPGGSMLALSLNEKEIRSYLNGKIDLALINTPGSCVLSGEFEVIEELYAELTAKEIGCRLLHTSHAFHSQMMDPILDEFTAKVQQFELKPPIIPFVSNVTGTWIEPDEAVDPIYWSKHLRQTVRFSDCVKTLMNEPNLILLEVGPGRTLSQLAKQNSQYTNHRVILSSTRHPKEELSDVACLLDTLGQLWLAGVEVDWSKFYAAERRRRLPLPTYPFERKRYWLNATSPLFSANRAEVSLVEDLTEATQNDPHQAREITDGDHTGTPRNDTEWKIAGIWQKVLGIEHVNIYDDFFDLGGSSLLALNLFAQINKTFGKNLPLATLFEAPTVAQLAHILGGDELKPTWTSLVEIQPGNDKTPLFLMHAEEGNVVGYRDLALYLGVDQPVYGLQAKGLGGEPISYSRIEEIAAEYIQDVRSVQQHGPYLLGGFCLGGILAYEMAQQLQAQGEQVALLIMIQARHQNYRKYLPNKTFIHRQIYRLMDRVDLETHNLSKLDLYGKFSYLLKRIERVMEIIQVRVMKIIEKPMGRYSKNFSHSMVYTYANVAKIFNEAYYSYFPRPYNGRVVIFRANKQPRGIYSDPTLGWKDLIEGELELHEIPAYHQTILLKPQVQYMAEILEQSINEDGIQHADD